MFVVRNSYRRWQNRHILGHLETLDIPTTTWPPTTRRPHPSVFPAVGESPGGGGPPMSHDQVEAQDQKSSNDIRVFDEHEHHGKYISTNRNSHVQSVFLSPAFVRFIIVYHCTLLDGRCPSISLCKARTCCSLSQSSKNQMTIDVVTPKSDSRYKTAAMTCI